MDFQYDKAYYDALNMIYYITHEKEFENDSKKCD